MLNMKKGLAVALAAATVLTFAPVSAFAGTTQTNSGSISRGPDGTVTSDTTVSLKTSMNETANVWSYNETLGKDATATELKAENTAVVVLTPSNPTGSVTFTKSVTAPDKDTLANGKWFSDNSAPALQGTASNKEVDGTVQLTAAKNGKTLSFRASMSALRALTEPVTYTVDKNLTGADLATDLSVKVVLAPHAVKMNNLKVVLSQAGDSALDRYKTHGADVYDSYEARPDVSTPVVSTANGKDIKTTDNNNVALDGVRIGTDAKEINLAVGKDLPFKEITTNADLEFKSDDQRVATVDKDGIHAKAVGETAVHISTKQNLTAYGVVTVDINVKVVNVPQAKLSAPTDLTVKGYGVKNATAIGAIGTNIQKNSIKYDFVYWDAVAQQFKSFRDADNSLANNKVNINPFRLSDSQDSVYVEQYPGYDTTAYNWNAYLEVKATGADGYKDPATVYTKLHFDNSAPFTLDATSQSLHTGESVQITTKSVSAVTGAAFTYKSYNPAVATVSDKGVITAVGEGSTTVDVTYAGYTQSLPVYVSNYENGNGSVSTPVKVTGVKVANVKGGKVKVTWTAADDSNVKYYVKKTVSGKSAGKSVGSNGTTLTVKKGATVKVKVKAYVYDNAGKKLVGAYSTTVTKKTDNK